MKVTVKEKSSVKEYPWIGIIDNGCIILFTSKNTGICLDRGSSVWKFGELSSGWSEDNFKPFTGEITLSNS